MSREFIDMKPKVTFLQTRVPVKSVSDRPLHDSSRKSPNLTFTSFLVAYCTASVYKCIL